VPVQVAAMSSSPKATRAGRPVRDMPMSGNVICGLAGRTIRRLAILIIVDPCQWPLIELESCGLDAGVGGTHRRHPRGALKALVVIFRTPAAAIRSDYPIGQRHDRGELR